PPTRTAVAMLLPLRAGQRRVAVLAICLGAVGFLMTLLSILFTDTFSSIAFAARSDPLMSILYVLLPVLTTGLYGLLLFYGSRLALRITKQDLRFITIDLGRVRIMCAPLLVDRKSTRLNSSHDQISYAVFCLKKKKINKNKQILTTEKTFYHIS